MSDIIRGFRITKAPYRRGDKTMDERKSPFVLPSYKKPERVPESVIEGVPPIAKPKEDRHDT